MKILLHAVGLDKHGLLWRPQQGGRKKTVLIRLICVFVCYIETKKIWVHSCSKESGVITIRKLVQRSNGKL